LIHFYKRPWLLSNSAQLLGGLSLVGNLCRVNSFTQL